MAVVFVAVAGVAGALAYSAWANEVEFDRLMAERRSRRWRPSAISRRSRPSAARWPGSPTRWSPTSSGARSTWIRASSTPRCETCAARPRSTRARSVPSSWSAMSTSRWGAPIAPPSATKPYVALDEQNARVLYKLGLARYRAGRPAAAVEAAPAGARVRSGAGRRALRAGPGRARSASVAGGARVARNIGAVVARRPDRVARSARRGLRTGRRSHQVDQSARGPGGAGAVAGRSARGGGPGPGARRARPMRRSRRSAARSSAFPRRRRPTPRWVTSG